MMNDKTLLDYIVIDEFYNNFFNNNEDLVIDNTIGVPLFFASLFLKKPDNYVLITSNLYSAQNLYSSLLSFLGEENVLFMPYDEMSKSELITSSKEISSQRLYGVCELCKNKKRIIVSHISSVLSPLPCKDRILSNTFKFKINDSINVNEFIQNLIDLGYTRSNKINQSLQFALRGDIIDIFAINYSMPIRIELFGDQIESISFFDISTQISSEELNEVNIPPASYQFVSSNEFNLNKNKILNYVNSFIDDKSILNFKDIQEEIESELDLLEEKNYTSKTEKYFCKICNNCCSYIDYIDDKSIYFINNDQIKISLDKLEEKFSNSENPFIRSKYLTNFLDYNEVFSKNKIRYIKPLKQFDKDFTLDVRPIFNPHINQSQIMEFIYSFMNCNNKVLISIENKIQLEKVCELLKSNDIDYELCEGFSLSINKKVGITLSNIKQGFEIPQYKIVCLASKELFNSTFSNGKTFNKFHEGIILKTYDDLQNGDFVVHEKYGIGKFIKMSTILIDGIHRDFLHIEYRNENMLYVPLSQFRLIRKYSSRDGFAPKLSLLNSGEWDKTKSRIKERINLLADRLFSLYSDRKNIDGFAFEKDDEFQNKFESEFPYELTRDQKSSLIEIKKDMESKYVMDRLLCGDVGFGKTEVAFRAIFKAIISGKQAILLCPTTLLARQHYERAVERFHNYGIKIAILSRLIPPAKQKQYIDAINNNQIDLIIGTHRLLSKSISYPNLGLLVIDEEHRFGVEQKELIKELKVNVDVLSLSATPIPRTLQMSLIGLRQVSQINTAPIQRTPIQTYILPFNSDLIKEVIEKELLRKGQVFYIHNVVASIYSCVHKIQEMIPYASIGVVHGQMNKEEIENVMMSFYNNEIDILVATSIIENGIDVANANLIIIEDADKFGLSQLYQIRGRVGRNDRIAYAYLFYRKTKELSDVATKRLKSIQDFVELGSGYKIAQRDLMIRGAGDLLGPEQAGFIDSIGIELYLKMLKESIEEKKTGYVKQKEKENTLFSIDAYIPDYYAICEDKIELYQEIENTDSLEDLTLLINKTSNIYGKLPEEVNLLFKKRKIDILLKNEEFEKVEDYANHIELTLSKLFTNINSIGTKLFDIMSPLIKYISVSYYNRLLKIKIKKDENWINILETVIECIDQLYEDLKNEN